MDKKLEKVLEWYSKKEKEHPLIFRFLLGFFGTLVPILTITIVVYVILEMSMITFIFLFIPMVVGILCCIMRGDS